MDQQGLGASLALLGCLIFLSGFFSGSETALFSLQAIDRENLRNNEDPNGDLVDRLLLDPRRTLASVLMGNELVNISLSTVCAGLVLAIAPDRAWLNLLVATPLLILFGEVTPKTIALRYPRRFALAIARPLNFWAVAVSPVRVVLTLIADQAIRLLGARTPRQSQVLEEAQVRKLIDEGHQAGSIRAMEAELIERVFDFGDLPVGRLMTPRPDVVSLPVTIPHAQLMVELARTRFSRVPIYQGHPDSVIGILLTKELLRYKGGAPLGPRELKALLREPYFVPGTKRADELLSDFRRRREHMALVVDEHGSIDGLVTLDDLLMELVGEDIDEDDTSDEISRVRAGVWTVSGAIDVDDFCDETGLELPEGDFHTLGGFVMHTLGRVPETGESLMLEGVRYTVAAMEGRRITEITIVLEGAKASVIGTPLLAALIVLVCLFSEGFFSGSEIAVVSADRLKLQTSAEEGSRGAGLALKMLERPEFLLGTCLIGTNLSTVTASTAATAALVEVWGDIGSVLAVAVLFPCILLAGELVPKSVFQHYADRLAPVVVFPLRAFSVLFRPILLVMEAATKLAFRITGSEGAVHRTVSREDIQMLLEGSEPLGIDAEDRELIQRVLDFHEATVEEVMIPLIEVQMVPENASAAEAVEALCETGHSRMPVYADRVDHVTGIVHHNDLLYLEDLEVPVHEIARPAHFVPESKAIEELFVELRRRRERIAIPVDEYGGAVGLITMEDILEEIVGDIADEHDVRQQPVRRVGEREWLASARIEVAELEGATGLCLPEGDYETLAGFLLSHMGKVPAVGEKLRAEGYQLEITQASDRAILEVRLRGPTG